MKKRFKCLFLSITLSVSIITSLVSIMPVYAMQSPNNQPVKQSITTLYKATNQDETICLSSNKVSINKGSTYSLRIFNNSTYVPKFKSSNKKVATVGSDGTIKGIKKGKCTITVKLGDKTLKCNVKVYNFNTKQLKKGVTLKAKLSGDYILYTIKNTLPIEVKVTAKKKYTYADGSEKTDIFLFAENVPAKSSVTIPSEASKSNGSNVVKIKLTNKKVDAPTESGTYIDKKQASYNITDVKIGDTLFGQKIGLTGEFYNKTNIPTEYLCSYKSSNYIVFYKNNSVVYAEDFYIHRSVCSGTADISFDAATEIESNDLTNIISFTDGYLPDDTEWDSYKIIKNYTYMDYNN